MAFTFFFRDHHTLDQLTNYFIPLVAGFSKVKIWDAGCAMGPEPYTLLIILAEKMGYYAFKSIQMHATDIDESENFGKTITDGIYPISDLKRMPENIFEKYFSPTGEGDLYKIDENVRSRIQFYQHDLLSLKPIDFGYHLILCKNVLLHFQPAERIEVMKMFHSALATNGLFATEQTQQMPEELHGMFERLTSDANVYRKISPGQ